MLSRLLDGMNVFVCKRCVNVGGLWIAYYRLHVSPQIHMLKLNPQCTLRIGTLEDD